MEEKKTFAEEVLDMVLTHDDCRITICFNPYCGLEMQMREYSATKGTIGAKQIIMPDLYEESKVSIDEIMTVAMLQLRKELDDYGRE